MAEPEYTAELTDAEIFAALGDVEDVVTAAPLPEASAPDSADPNPNAVAGKAGGTGDGTVAAAKAGAPDIDAKLAQAIAPLTQGLTALQGQLAQAAEQGGKVAPEVVGAIQSLQAQIRQMKLDALPDEDKWRFLEQERQEQQRTQAEVQRQQEVQRAQQQQTGAGETQVQAQHGNIFQTAIIPAALTLATTHGVSAEEAQADLKTSTVYPVRDAQGRLTGYDWDRYLKDVGKMWQDRAAARDGAREQSRSGGDGSRAGGAVPSQFDPYDKKYIGNTSQMLHDGLVAAGA